MTTTKPEASARRVRASVYVSTDRSQAAQAEAFLAWFGQHEEALFYASSNHGCPCCFDGLDLEGPAGVIATLPERWTRPSPWTRGEKVSPSSRQVPPRLKLNALGPAPRSPRRR